MIDLLIVAAIAAVLLGWVRPRGFPAARGWRVAAGFLPIALLAAAAFVVMRGEWIAGLALGAAAIGSALSARWPRTRPAASPAGGMSLDEARATLGVDAGAGEAEIQAAYVRLMRRVHPDHGGASGLAVQLNLARERLLRR